MSHATLSRQLGLPIRLAIREREWELACCELSLADGLSTWTGTSFDSCWAQH